MVAIEPEVQLAHEPPAQTVLDRPLFAGMRIDGAIVAYVTLVLVALVLRLIMLGDKPLHHDESQDAYFSWVLFTGGGYQYNPLLHGPLRFYLDALSYLLFGANNFTARLAPALMGTAMVAMPYFLRRQIGSVAAFIAAALLCAEPAFLYFSRFTREDIFIASLTLALLVTTFSFLDKPKYWQPALVTGLLAASFATKETTYITVFVAGTFFLGALGWQVVQGRRLGIPFADLPLVGTVRSVGLDSWLWALASFVAVFTLLFTTFFTNPAGLYDGLVKSIQYWLSQQPVGRGAEPWFYYFMLLATYAWPELILAGVGLVTILKRPTLLGLFFVWAFALSLVVYSWAGEKMPWLLIHILLPLLFIAGIGVQTLWQNRRQVAGTIGLVIAGIGAVYLIHSSTLLAYTHPADPAEFLVFTQTSVAAPVVTTQLLDIDRRTFDAAGNHLKVEIDTWDGVDWPWAWYLRDLPSVSYVDMSQPSYTPSGQALLLDDPSRANLLAKLGNYTGYRFPLRVWWVTDFKGVTWSNWLDWLLWRKTWSATGSLDEWLYVRNDVPGVQLIGGMPAVAGQTNTGTQAVPVAPAAALPVPSVVTPLSVIGEGTGQTTPLDQPRQVAVLADGSVLVVDQGNSTVTKFDAKGAVVATYTGANTAGGPLKNPTGVGVDSQGNVFVADTWNHRIVKLGPNLQFIKAWGSYASTNGVVSASPGQFYGPRAIAVDAKGNVYVTDTGNKRIQEFTNDGAPVAQFGGVGNAPGQLNEPVGLAFTPTGDLVVADLWNRRIQVLGPDGAPKHEWTVPGWQVNVHNEPYVAVGANGDIYVSDPMAQPGRILVYSADGAPQAVWIVSGTPLNYPTGIAIGSDNRLYVTDSQNHRVLVLAGLP